MRSVWLNRDGSNPLFIFISSTRDFLGVKEKMPWWKMVFFKYYLTCTEVEIKWKRPLERKFQPRGFGYNSNIIKKNWNYIGKMGKHKFTKEKSIPLTSNEKKV